MSQTLVDRLLLTIILLAIFVVPGSISGTAVALPAIGIDTHASLTSLQWVVNAFNLTFACFTLAWGALADRLGRKRCFVIGTVIYSVASSLSALAADPLLLDAARAMAGIGAAAVFSCGIAIISTHFDGPARIRAFALFGTVAGLGVSLGPTMSGVLLDHVGWRAIFWTHAIVLLLVFLGSPIIRADVQRTQTPHPFDTLGAALFISALLSLMMAIVQGSQWGWGSNGVRGFCLAFAILMTLFVRQERRHPQPMLDLSLLRNGKYVGFGLVTVAGSLGFVTLLTYLPSYLTGVMQLTATHAGLAMLLLTMPMLVCPMLAAKLATRGVASTKLLNVSMMCLLVGVVTLALVSHPGVILWQLAVPLLLTGSGMGLSAGLVDGMALSTVPEQKVGMAAGLLNTFRLGSEAIAVAFYASLLATFIDKYLHHILSDLANDAVTLKRWINDVAAGNLGAPVQAVAAKQADVFQNLLIAGYDHAFHDVLWILSAVILVVSISIAWLIRPRTALLHG